MYEDADEIEKILEDELVPLGVKVACNHLCCGGCWGASFSEGDFAIGWHLQDDQTAFNYEDEYWQCGECGGTGVERCDSCNGTGEIACYECGGTGEYEDDEGDEVSCEECDSTGDLSCGDCQGQGEYDCGSCNGNGEEFDGERRVNGNLTGKLYLRYGGPNDDATVALGLLAQSALENGGYNVEWDGDPGKCLIVTA